MNLDLDIPPGESEVIDTRTVTYHGEDDLKTLGIMAHMRLFRVSILNGVVRGDGAAECGTELQCLAACEGSDVGCFGCVNSESSERGAAGFAADARCTRDEGRTGSNLASTARDFTVSGNKRASCRRLEGMKP